MNEYDITIAEQGSRKRDRLRKKLQIIDFDKPKDIPAKKREHSRKKINLRSI